MTIVRQSSKDRALACAAPLLLAALWGFLAWVAWTLTVEYYDGFEYLLTGRALWTHGLASLPISLPKSPALSAWLGLALAPERLGNWPASLRGSHLAMLALNVAGAFIAARFILGLRIVRLPMAAVLGVICFNRLFAHYAPFAMTDLPVAFSTAAVFWTEARLPLETLEGKAARAVLLALFFVGRAQAGVIPAVALLAAAWRGRRFLDAAVVAVAAALAAALFLAVFYRLCAGVGPVTAWAAHRQAILGLAIDFSRSKAFRAPLVYFDYLRLLLTPAGLLLAAAGLARLREPSVRLALRCLAGPALGVAAYLIVIFLYPSQEARYLSPLLALWALAQCLSLQWLSERRPAAATACLAVLCLLTVPELRHFAQPFYREDGERRLSRDIAAWSGAEAFIFAGSSAPFFPERHVFDPDDNYFYVYHWNAQAFAFFTGRAVQEATVSFSKRGWPVPDGIEQLPSGKALVVLMPRSESTSDLSTAKEEVNAFRRAGPESACAIPAAGACIAEKAFALR